MVSRPSLTSIMNHVTIEAVGTTKPRRIAVKPLGDRFSESHIKRFTSKVNKSGGDDACWPWTGSTVRDGYGFITFSGTGIGSHRVAWMLANKIAITPRVMVCHSCDNPPCCNPKHLFLGLNKHNMADMVLKGRSASGERHRFHRYPETIPRGLPWRNLLMPHYRRGEASSHAKLTNREVRRLHALYYTHGYCIKEISERVGRPRSTVSQICSGSRWPHLYEQIHGHPPVRPRSSSSPEVNKALGIVVKHRRRRLSITEASATIDKILAEKRSA